MRERLVRAAEGEGRDVRLRIERSGDTFRGDLTLGRGDAQLSRMVRARTCEAVVDALVLIASLDPAALAAQPAEPAPEAPAPPTAAPPTSAPSPPAIAPPPPSTPRDAAPPATPSPASHRELALGASLFALPLQSAQTSQGAAVFAELAWAEGLFGAAALRPSLRVALARTLLDAGDPLVALTLTSVQLDACPVRASVSPALDLGACARLEGGALRGDAQSYLGETRAFGAAGIVGRARVTAFTVRDMRVFLELAGGGTMPFVRDTFVFARTFPSPAKGYGARVPVAAWTGALTLGLVLP